MAAQSINQLVKFEYKEFDARQLLQKSPIALIGIEEANLDALKLLSINSIFDLVLGQG